MTTLQKSFGLMLVVVTLIAVYLLQPILAPFLTGMILAYLGDPLVDRLETKRVNRTLGVLIVFAVFGAVLLGGLLIVLPMLMREIAALIKDIPVFVGWLQENAGPIIQETFGVDPFAVGLDSMAVQVKDNWQQAGGVVGTILGQVTQSTFSFIGALGVVGLTPVVAFYMMRDWDEMVTAIREMVPRNIEPTFVKLCRESDEVLGAFLQGQLLIMFLLGCAYAIGLYIVGLELALLIGMLAGLASIVPYLGFFVGIIAAVIAAMFQFGEPIYLVYIGIVFGIGQALEGWVLTPWLVGDKIGLHPVAVIFAVLAGGQLFGFVGVLLALPVAAVIMVFVRYLHDQYRESEYYDTEEAVEEFADDMSTEDSSDEPAATSEFKLEGHCSLEDYVGLAADKLRQLQGTVLVYGARGSGKSHLLQGLCHEADTAIYLPMLSILEPGVLIDLENSQLVCLDDIDGVLDEPAWQVALFHLINACRDQGSTLVMSSQTRLDEIALTDLASRVNAAYQVVTDTLTDEEKLTVIRIKSKRRGFEMSDEVCSFILDRSPRDMHHLARLVEQLDEATLRRQKKVTIPFVKDALGL